MDASSKLHDAVELPRVRECFEDAFARYLPASDSPQRHNTAEQDNGHESACATAATCGVSESCETDYENSTCGVVADETLSPDSG